MRRSHTQIVPSPLPLASVYPSGEDATDVTSSVCPERVCKWSPVRAFHKRIVLSSPPLASLNPSVENATEVTPL